jgi:drug/metabolite transporter (DMT)-like permease
MLLMAEFCFALSTVFGKLVTESSAVPGVEVSFFRYLLGFMVFLFYLLAKGKSFRPNNIRHVVLRGVTNTIAVILFFAGLQYTTVTNANMLNMTYPVFVFIVAPFINREKSTSGNVVYLAVTMAGVYLIVAPDFNHINPGDVLALGSGIMAGLGIPYLREARKYDDSEMILFYLMLIGTVINFIVAAPVFVMPEGIIRAWILFSALSAVTAQFFLTVGYRYIEAASGSLVSASRILFAGIMGVSLFADPLTPQIVFGGVLILISLAGVSGFMKRFAQFDA